MGTFNLSPTTVGIVAKAKATASEIDDIFSGKPATISTPPPSASERSDKKKKKKSKITPAPETEDTLEDSKPSQTAPDIVSSSKLEPKLAKKQPEEVVFAVPGLPASAMAKMSANISTGRKRPMAANDDDGFSDSRGKKSRMLLGIWV